MGLCSLKTAVLKSYPLVPLSVTWLGGTAFTWVCTHSHLKPRETQTSFPCQTMTRQATIRSFHSVIGGVPSAVLPSKFPQVRSRSQSPFPCTPQTSRAPWSLSPISSPLREGIRASMFEPVSHRGESCQFPPVLGTPISSCSFLEPSQLV